MKSRSLRWLTDWRLLMAFGLLPAVFGVMLASCKPAPKPGAEALGPSLQLPAAKRKSVV